MSYDWEMGILNLVWLVGGAIVVLAWFRKVPVWLGWLGFLIPMYIFYMGEGLSDGLDWIILWGMGVFLVVIGWIPRVHRSIGWTGLFITMLAAGMEWIDNQARQLWEPIIVIRPEVDLLIFSALGYGLTQEYVFRYVKRNPELMQRLEYVDYLRRKTDELHEQKSQELEISVATLTMRTIEAYWAFLQQIGGVIAIGILLSVLGFLVYAANYYDSGIEFSFIFFSTNWFWAVVINIFTVGLPILYIQEKYHGISFSFPVK